MRSAEQPAASQASRSRSRPRLLQMYKAPPRPESVSPVGRYAISFRWNDGHQSGIYSWDYLRRSCQCDLCRAAAPR